MLRVLRGLGGLSLLVAPVFLLPGACGGDSCYDRGIRYRQVETMDPSEWVDEEGNFLGDCEKLCNAADTDLDYACTVTEVIPGADGAPGGSGGLGGGGGIASTETRLFILCEPLEEYCSEPH